VIENTAGGIVGFTAFVILLVAAICSLSMIEGHPVGGLLDDYL
jgi:hypothetical protein